MQEALRQYITGQLGRTPDHLEEVLAQFDPLTLARGTYLFREGEICRYVYFVVGGCLQAFVIDKNGNESTREFYREQQWATDIFGFRNQEPVREFLKCVEPCRLLSIHYDRFQYLAGAVPEFMRIYREILEASYQRTIGRINTFTAMNALDRLRWLTEYQPELLTRLPGKLVASYLGISPETLTRLRAKL